MTTAATSDRQPGRGGPGRLVLAGAMIVAWLVLVITGSAYHEMWKDEGRALAMALSADGIFGVPAAIQGDGHPALWYVLLYMGHAVWPSNLILPVVSIVVAGLAIAVFALWAPFPIWWKVLFLLTGFSVYEYSVMARNYGISMLLMFLVCLALPRPRRNGLLVGVLLFLLAQTNVHSTMLVPLLCGIWVWFGWTATGTLRPRIDRGMVLCVALTVIGMLAAALTVYPPRHTRVVETLTDTYFHRSYLVTAAIILAEPGHFFRLVTRLPSMVGSVMLFAAVLGLLRWPILCAAGLAGLWGSAAFFALVYNGGYRHQAIWLVFLVSLYWIGLARDRVAPAGQAMVVMAGLRTGLFRLALYGVLPILLAINAYTGFQKLDVDVRYEVSKSRALGAALADGLGNAVIVTEPDELNDVVGYYADNPPYLLREHRFGRIATFAEAEQKDLTLAQVLDTMRELKRSTGRPVVFASELPITDAPEGGSFALMWGRRFSYTPEEARAFLAATRRLPLGAPAVNENFDAFVLD